MTRAGLVVALVAAAMLQAIPAESRNCYSKAEFEAEQAILFQTNLMVVSSACHDASYVTFRMHNASAIIRYQHEMIDYFRHTGSRQPARSFETWITHLANEAAEKETGTPTPQICQQAASMLKLAGGLQPKQFHDLVAARAAADPDPAHPLCK
jgi:3-keto-L-gulonate-6-phosphate decarboxylase